VAWAEKGGCEGGQGCAGVQWELLQRFASGWRVPVEFLILFIFALVFGS